VDVRMAHGMSLRGLLVLALGTLVLSASDPSGRASGDAGWIPVAVHVVLVGFDDELPVAPAELRRLLESSLPLAQPSLVKTSEVFETQTVLQYTVHRAEDAQRHALQDAVVAAAKAEPAVYSASLEGSERAVVDVDAKRLEDAYAQLYDELVGGVNKAPGGDSSSSKPNTYLVVIQRLSADEMSPKFPAMHIQGSPTLHRLRYARSVPTQAFVGKGRYLVVDLSAAPCHYGMLGADGSVSESTFPRLEVVGENTSADEQRVIVAVAMRAISALVVSAVRFVLAPSVRFCPASASSVLMPVIALRDHEDAADVTQVDAAIASLRTEVQRWNISGIDVSILASTHPLHTHPSLAIALSRALRSATTHEIYAGRFTPIAKPFLDASELLLNIARSADALGGELMRASAADGGGALSSALGTATAAFRRATQAAEDGAPVGSRLLPVYLLSLASEDARTVLKANLVGHDLGADITGGARAAAGAAHSAHGRAEAGLLSVSSVAVVVLQPTEEKVNTGHFSSDGEAFADGRDATRHLVAGVLGALAGVMPPHETFSHVTAQTETSYVWAVGAHPFGPFATTSTVSDIFIDVATRNQLLCQLRAIEIQLDAAEHAVDRFAHDFLRAEPGNRQTGGSLAPWDGFAEHVWENRRQQPDTMPLVFVSRLVPQSRELRAQLGALQDAVEIAVLLPSESFAQFSSLLVAASALSVRAQAEVISARIDLGCCALLHDVSLPLSSYLYLLLLTFGALAAVGVAVARRRGGAQKYSLRSMRVAREHASRRL